MTPSASTADQTQQASSAPTVLSVAWLPDIGKLHADPPIEKAVEIANGSNLCGALLGDGTVRVLQPPSIHPSLAEALRPPADLGKAYALRVNGRVCAAQMADGTWRAWGSDAPDLIVQINNLGPAVDILFYAGKKAQTTLPPLDRTRKF